MALTPSASFVVSSILSLLTFSGMQMAKPVLSGSQAFTILGGFLGSLLFIFLLTALGNMEILLFGAGHQTKLLEVSLALILSALLSGTIHRVSASTCILFSLGLLYSMLKISQETYSSSHQETHHHEKSSKRRK
ncbi:Keratinocyteassociated protein 2 [Caligus rogercresseyi]|uniref:Keratinocyteassociated protein 2 n=1 Tax=Caligus rogercresseyi TaxID=217165 RepID=A0A7T8QVJ4_CALRO|nr:Keratinocyteassociated protein 2 [Caligus rogercresseyi]|eukprot:TRINITY_DN7174_c0_g1_i1.p1 TRINITY_DN7174_c0_g1~~TRINITY_DN7174_c0_g1_i1.p1  ORF type:complete len:134 (-),score=51.61 TRINITY_DN7174_c0_g1_i1:1695-2096(-)